MIHTPVFYNDSYVDTAISIQAAFEHAKGDKARDSAVTAAYRLGQCAWTDPGTVESVADTFKGLLKVEFLRGVQASVRNGLAPPELKLFADKALTRIMQF